MRFAFYRLLARCGLFYYDGLIGFEPSWYPLARVKYGAGKHSFPMAIGNAMEYARIFNGTVVEAKPK